MAQTPKCENCGELTPPREIFTYSGWCEDCRIGIPPSSHNAVVNELGGDHRHRKGGVKSDD